MSIEYERKLEAQFDDFCKYKCRMKNDFEIRKDEIEVQCDDCGGNMDEYFEFEVDPCDFCKIKEFIVYVRDEN